MFSKNVMLNFCDRVYHLLFHGTSLHIKEIEWMIVTKIDMF